MDSATLLSGKLKYEHQTISAMAKIFCKANHQGQTEAGLCSECLALLEYAALRLDRCPYGQNKPTCNKCPVHCYKPNQKQQVKEMMIFAGPRMLLTHPIRAIKHLLAERSPVPDTVPEAASNRHQRLACTQKKPV
ncbi:nitrous oxide-stimulated promoter family protein [Shewanella acanthi]|uniref:nitrous oxide-stimulated promoter family protein n=1 Tax=Shewanella acanthi TaxID=2864212 RepID=UPI001C65B100|nr:nitrous oxide-stimulated promoter family protein [Shewanella acanthi]QYJ78601.1 nitrous oxide-stimulated promoter family protein [Shewanella acanthi]